MKLILLSGGSGKRLWPLSNDARSKQFLRLLQNDEGEMESMIQRIWKQLGAANLQRESVITTSHTQVDMIQNQIGSDVELLVEPQRRDTFPAIALAAVYLYSMKEISMNEICVVMPVDAYVEDTFFEKIKELEAVLGDSEAELALIGVKPTYPSEKYGYIVPYRNQDSMSYYHVNHFTEKPTREVAQELIAHDALWNCGVFAFRLETMIAGLIDRGIPIHFEELLRQYQSLQPISFDYEIVEKTNRIAVLPYEGSWSDLGTWNTLTDQMVDNQVGKGLVDESSCSTHLVNELDIPIVVLGMSNAIVAASPDGILISDKSVSHQVKDWVKDIGTRPMFEERRWGWYKVLDHAKSLDGREVLTKRIGVAAGKNLSYQLHYMRSEVWTIIRGEGIFCLNDKIFHVKTGDVITIPVEAKHAIKALTDLEFIEVQTGQSLVEEDIIRIYMTWEEIEKNGAWV
ncbi:sugar phosphate nucleotidyltransferase [Brevibacillus choshinensis]|uniref:sugar phosphate nucleotidyltransferase n=1 Tax=Brevibacillus choshinensis TaxID=54911 RepID=UPI002E1DEFA5|nr:sugar phosphate nucleotidyltransferase [Brevibacillus choshinensis]MED4583103.1 sugar phosphate nucleotidyltransferase [Brevibacillus choshinensis]MED4753022.1 sugar phosphate nucleotidyltransferase [Brevibacillus choshinensis]MED4781401.1 sugar phosphate nucleotidyltransferase [Brevibacillus choshinensis]